MPASFHGMEFQCASFTDAMASVWAYMISKSFSNTCCSSELQPCTSAISNFAHCHHSCTDTA
eukprot:12935391-Prorocentrum_lima.AAC.1